MCGRDNEHIDFDQNMIFMSSFVTLIDLISLSESEEECWFKAAFQIHKVLGRAVCDKSTNFKGLKFLSLLLSHQNTYIIVSRQH